MSAQPSKLSSALILLNPLKIFTGHFRGPERAQGARGTPAIRMVKHRGDYLIKLVSHYVPNESLKRHHA